MFSNLYPPVVSGSSTQSSLLAYELTRQGHEVGVITAQLTSGQPLNECIEGVQVHRLPAFRIPKMGIALNFPWLSYTYTPANQQRIKTILQEFRPTILHLHNHMFDLGFSAVQMRKQFNIPLVVTLHTMIKHSLPLYNLFLYPADRIFLRRTILNNSDYLIHPDVNIEEYSKEAFGDKRGRIVPYGVNLMDSADMEQVEALKQQYNLHGKKVILSLGHVHEIRNRKDLVEAMPAILKAHPDAVLLIVGAVASETPGRIAKQLGVENSVIFTGAVEHRKVAAFLALAQLESHWLNQDDPDKTSLGVASLEAMGAGKTVLAAANPHTYGKGVLRNGENFIQVEPNKPQQLAQTIIDLLNDPERCQRIGKIAKQTIEENFSWESVCSRTLAIYKEAQQS